MIRQGFDIFRRGAERVFFENRGKIPTCGETEKHGNVCDRHVLLQQDFCILYFLLVNESPRRDSQLLFKFLLILGAGEMGNGGQFLQGKLRSNMIQYIVQGFSDVRSEQELLLLGTGDYKVKKQQQIGGIIRGSAPI